MSFHRSTNPPPLGTAVHKSQPEINRQLTAPPAPAEQVPARTQTGVSSTQGYVSELVSAAHNGVAFDIRCT